MHPKIFLIMGTPHQKGQFWGQHIKRCYPQKHQRGVYRFLGQLLGFQAAAVAYQEMQLYMLRLEKALQTSSHAEVPRFKIQAAGLGFRV